MVASVPPEYVSHLSIFPSPSVSSSTAVSTPLLKYSRREILPSCLVARSTRSSVGSPPSALPPAERLVLVEPFEPVEPFELFVLFGSRWYSHRSTLPSPSSSTSTRTTREPS